VPIGYDLDRLRPGRANGLLKEPAGCRRVASQGHKHVDDLPELVNGAVHIAPAACHLQVGLIGLPAIADGMAAGAGGLGQPRLAAA